MNTPTHDHQHPHGESTNRHRPTGQGLHKDWRAWLVVLLMLAAMAVYLLTIDESLRPGVSPEQVSPSDVETPLE